MRVGGPERWWWSAEGVCVLRDEEGGVVGDCAIKIVGRKTNALCPKDSAAIRAADEGDERRRS